MSARELPYHVGDFAFFIDRPNHDRLVVVWMVHQDGRLELIGANRDRFELNYFVAPELIRKPNETEGRMIASVWFSVSSATGVRWDRAVQAGTTEGESKS